MSSLTDNYNEEIMNQTSIIRHPSTIVQNNTNIRKNKLRVQKNKEKDKNKTISETQKKAMKSLNENGNL